MKRMKNMRKEMILMKIKYHIYNLFEEKPEALEQEWLDHTNGIELSWKVHKSTIFFKDLNMKFEKIYVTIGRNQWKESLHSSGLSGS